MRWAVYLDHDLKGRFRRLDLACACANFWSKHARDCAVLAGLHTYPAPEIRKE